MKFYSLILASMLAFSACGQTNGPVFEKSVTGIPITTNQPAVSSTEPLVVNPDGTISVSPDLLNVIPVKYKSLVILLLALTPTFIKIAHELKTPGSTVGGSLVNAVTGRSQAVLNEIAQLKRRTALPLVPAPPAPVVTPPTPAPIVPLTSLPPNPPAP